MMKSFILRKIQHSADCAAAGCAVALGVAIPVSTALDSILLVFFLFFWLAGDVPAKIKAIRNNPVAMASLGLFMVLLLGTLYGDASIGQKLILLSKYKALLCIPLLVPFFADERIRRSGFYGFTAVIIVTLVLSAMIKTGALPVLNQWFAVNPLVGATVFKGHIAQSYMMAVAAFIYSAHAKEATGRKRLLFGLLAAGCLSNILFMIYGRTGYLVLAVLMLYFFATMRHHMKGGLVGGVAVLIVLATFTAAFSHKFDHRIDAAVHDAEQWSPKKADHTSNGLRLEFYHNTLALIRLHPVLGVGTGGFENAYRKQVAGTHMIATHNPHNDMLLMTAQLGLIGLAALLFFYACYWKQAAYLAGAHNRAMARAILLSLMVGGIVNSLLINHVESLFFAWWSAWVFGGGFAQRIVSPVKEEASILAPVPMPVEREMR